MPRHCCHFPGLHLQRPPPEGKTDVHRIYGKFCYKGYRHSLCHGWASGPTSWLSEYVFGIRPAGSGRNNCKETIIIQKGGSK